MSIELAASLTMSGVYLASTGDASPKSKKITATTGSRPVRHCSAISLLSSTAKPLIPGFRVAPGSDPLETGDVNAARGEDSHDLGPGACGIVHGHPKYRSVAPDAADQSRLTENGHQIRAGGGLARFELDREHRLRKPRLELRHRR